MNIVSIKLREQKTPAWEAAKFALRLAIFYAPLLISLITSIEGEGILAALGAVVMTLDKWKYETSGKGVVNF